LATAYSNGGSWEVGKLSKDKDFAVIAVAQLPNFSALSASARKARLVFDFQGKK